MCSESFETIAGTAMITSTKSVHVQSNMLLDGMRECCQNGTSSAASLNVDQRTGDTGDPSNELNLVDKKNTKSDIWKYFALRVTVHATDNVQNSAKFCN